MLANTDPPDPDARAETESDPAKLAWLIERPDPGVRRGLARNPFTPIDTLASLAADFPQDVLGNATIQMMLLADPAALQSWPLESLRALARSPSTGAGVLAALLAEFGMDRRGDPTPTGKLTLLRDLLHAPQMPAGAIRSFLGRAANRRNEWCELALMHEALRPETATSHDAVVKIGEVLGHRPALECTPDLLKLPSRHPAYWQVVASMSTALRVVTAIRTGGTTSPAFADLVNDGTYDEVARINLPDTRNDLLTDAPAQGLEPSDEAEYRAWVGSNQAKRHAAALMSRFATPEDLDTGARSERPTVRKAATEGMKRRKLCDPRERPDLGAYPNFWQLAHDVLAVVRWPSFNGECMLSAIESHLRGNRRRDTQTQDPNVEIFVAMLARTDLDPLVRQRIIDVAPDVVARCAHSTSEMLGRVMRAPTTMRIRAVAARHPSSHPSDVEWLRSPEGMLDSMKAHFLGGTELLAHAENDAVPLQGEAIAWETHGKRTGQGDRLIAILVDDCPIPLLELRAGSTCAVERTLVAMHPRTTEPILAQLKSDPCWTVRTAAAAPRQRVEPRGGTDSGKGLRAQAASARAKAAATVRPKMSAIRKRLASGDWDTVRMAIQEIAATDDRELISLMHRDVDIRISERSSGERHLQVVAGRNSEIHRRVRDDFRQEAALEFVRSRLGPGAPRADGGTIRKSLRDVSGFPTLEHYLPSSVDLVIDDCARFGAAAMSITGLDAVAALDFRETRGIIPMLPSFEQARSVRGFTGATASKPNPLAALERLPNLVDVRLWVRSIDAGLGDATHDLATHPRLRKLELTPSSASNRRLSMVLRCSTDHRQLQMLSLSNLRVRAEAGSRLLAATTIRFSNCELDPSIAELIPASRDLAICNCAAPLPMKLLDLPGLARLAIQTDLQTRCLKLESTADSIEDLTVRSVFGLEQIECGVSRDSLTTLHILGCNALQRITLGPSMPRLRQIVVEDCPNLHSIRLPNVCGELQLLRIARAGKLKSADDVVAGCDCPALEEIQFDGCSSLEDVDALARIPTLRVIDLRRCKSLKSVAALRGLGPSVRVHLWAAAHADGESRLAAGVATRDQNPSSSERRSPAVVPKGILTADLLDDPSKRQLAAIVCALLHPLGSGSPTEMATAESDLRKLVRSTDASDAFRHEAAVAAVECLRPHAASATAPQATKAFEIARLLDDRAADSFLLENIDPGVQADPSLRDSAARELVDLAYEDHLPGDRIESIRLGVAGCSRLETSGVVLGHHIDAMGRLLCRRHLPEAQADSIAGTEAAIIGDVANRFLDGGDDELLRGLQHGLVLVRRHLAYGAQAGRRTLVPEVMPILRRLVALAHAPLPILQRRPNTKPAFDLMISSADLLLRFCESGGLHMDSGFLCDLFVTDAVQQRVVLSNALVLPHEGNIDGTEQLTALLDMVAKTNRPVLIFAADVTGQALCELVRRSRSGLRACVVRAPGTGESLRACLDDIAALTGAKAVTRDSIFTLDDVTIAELGHAGFIAVDRDSTQIIGGGGTMVEIDAHRRRLRGEVEAASGWDRERAENRLARFEAALPPDD